MSNLHEYIIKSAQSYLTYLEDNNLGTEEIKIAKATLHSINMLDKHSKDIHKKYVLTLSLEQQIIATDYLQLYIDSLMIDLDLIEEKNYNERTHTLDIIFDNSNLQEETKEKFCKLLEDSNNILLHNNIANHTKLFVDLKFLVKNILSFCCQELNLCLPNTRPLELKIKLESYINNEQKNAIEGIFNNPISYIWGISGSGKTQVVLFSCLLNIITQNKKALILAPTNTALEQIFTALINKCDTKGIARTKFLRLGMPSSEFLSHYPEVCIQGDDEDSKKESTRLFNIPNLKDRLAECLIIGLTLDSFIKRYQILSTLDFAHIFLDECAFSPLIKLIAPLQLNTPITLLGDHKQLMPICLMDNNTITTKNNEVCLWSLNALFIESMLNNHDKLHLANNHDEILFKDIANYKLTITHRYGDNLAQILDRYVYHNNLRGVGKETQIYFIDSKVYGQGYSYIASSNNESLAEANAILSIARNLGEYAVITPFKDQQKLLVRKGLQRSRVFTIHKSQGKEFDCIVFSPVKFSKFMTNSMYKSALFSLNVAISRLRQSLIIVCDYDFWVKKQGQLISSLLQIAKPYHNGHL
ncbi:hypothetical protein LS73_002330 [Helicobacter muridarum]|uniref:Putative DNA helicase n=1 Tax=Helicobacter muridarum TaxID=216 RepID=A0A099TVN9_9HELI|nr:AAA domain-containing protein [Helicobacter muridarum]TLE01132.1 hypothetical protein LS73_002330 [Helicobacter muridarum]STQ86000.1 putative DNA helicase [Helicobacter muridarum]